MASREAIREIIETPELSLALDAYAARYESLLDVIDPDASEQVAAVTTPFASAWRSEVRPDDRIQLLPGAADRELPVDIEALRPFLHRFASGADVRTLASEEHLEVGKVAALVRAGLGSTFENISLRELGTRVDHLELSRWPCAVHEISRVFWENSIDVRRAVSEQLASAVESPRAFESFLRELHVVYLMGTSLRSLYYPPSNVGGWPRPGRFRRPGANIECVMEAGFASYFTLLGVCLDDPYALALNQPQRDDDGLVWGHTSWRWTNRNADRQSRGWAAFHPISLLSLDHIERLWSSARDAHLAAVRGAVPQAVDAAASFLQRFACAHPFEGGNVGLAMNIVNHVLHEALHGFVPVMHLDYCAHRFSPRSFVRIFRRAVDRFLVTDDPESKAVVLARFANVRRVAAEMNASTAEHDGNMAADDLPQEVRRDLLLE